MTSSFTPDDAFAETLHQIYLVLWRSNLPKRSKQRCFEWAADSNETWRIVGITRDALQELMTHGKSSNLKRGHALGRAQRAAEIFERPAPMEKAALMEFFFAHDTTTLVTAQENSKEGDAHWSKPITKVPREFFRPSGISYTMNKGDLGWAAEQAQRLGIKRGSDEQET